MKTDNLSLETKEFLKKDSTKSFLFAVRQFISLMETTPEHKKLFYYKMHSALLDLYKAGYNLEEIDLKYSNADSHFEIAKTKYPQNAKLFSEFEAYDFYWQASYPGNKEVQGSYLSMNLVEIYGDLKEELEKIDEIETNEAVEDALWNLKWDYNYHWGEHSIDALRCLHYYFIK